MKTFAKKFAQTEKTLRSKFSEKVEKLRLLCVCVCVMPMLNLEKEILKL
jgi:hypothetical protein